LNDKGRAANGGAAFRLLKARPMTDTQLDEPRPAELKLPPVVPGRSCGTCMFCCKVMAIDEIAKPGNAWCPNCVRGQGCKVYDTRPTECRTFFCHWMMEKNLPDEWKPDRAKFVLVMNPGGHLTLFVDSSVPGAWRKSPYFETIKRWATEGTRSNPARIVMVRIGTRGIVVLPDREVEVGNIAPGEAITLDGRPDGTITVHKFKRESAPTP
jgi:hypothetical protein